jgi:hypothetical protein
MRVTLGERLGITFHTPKARPSVTPQSDGIPEEIEPEVVQPINVIRVRGAPSSTLPLGYPWTRPDDGGPPRVRGEMVWLHKTAPTLVIEGRPGLTAEEHAAGRRR